jgi:hypothetical protein
MTISHSPESVRVPAPPTTMTLPLRLRPSDFALNVPLISFIQPMALPAISEETTKRFLKLCTIANLSIRAARLVPLAVLPPNRRFYRRYLRGVEIEFFKNPRIFGVTQCPSSRIVVFSRSYHRTASVTQVA